MGYPPLLERMFGQSRHTDAQTEENVLTTNWGLAGWLANSSLRGRHGTVRELYTVTHCCTVALSSVLRLNPWITLYFHLESTFVIDSYKEAD